MLESIHVLLLPSCYTINVYAKKQMFEVESCVRGFHIYKDFWTPAIGEVLVCTRERRNAVDRYAVSVVKDDNVVGHLPRKISKVCSLFLERGGTINCRITGARRYSFDLPQGGVEVPCFLLFFGSEKDIVKVKRLFKHHCDKKPSKKPSH